MEEKNTMEEKNNIIERYADCLITYTRTLFETANTLTSDNENENECVITSLNIQLETLRSGITVLQNALDKYKD